MRRVLLAAAALVACRSTPDPSPPGAVPPDDAIVNPVVRQRADPHVVRDADGAYYLAATVPEYDRIELRRARSIGALGRAEPVVVWRKHATGEMGAHVWAPELHRIDGTWYVYFAAGRADSVWNIRMYVLECACADPLRGPWVERGQIRTGWESFALDATTFAHRGTRYLVWAQKSPDVRGNSNLYIAAMASPWTIRGTPTLLSTPELPWETIGFRVNEGPAVLVRNGRVFLTYSASATDANYAMGLLTASDTSDLLDARSWTKSPEPVFRTSETAGQYGPGHNSFTTDLAGRDVMAYHARAYRDIVGDPLRDPNRHTRAQRLRWRADGTPDFGAPVPDGPETTPAPAGPRLTTLGTGWARSSVNAVAFRTSPLVTHGDTQYAAYYDDSARVVLARRRVSPGESRGWETRVTPYANDVRDAHNAISIAVDGAGVLHVAWARHDRPLQYARGVRPGALELSPPTAMTGLREARVTYPQFYLLPGGDLLFAYRDGASGRGDALLNRWDVRRQRWRAVAHPLIDGEGARNAYLNTIAIDARGGWHVSWVWRESPDVASNHDVMYAFSPDEGRTWRTSAGAAYALPITAATAETAWRVPQGSELINQTSSAVDGAGRPLIATYWRPAGTEVPQLQLVWHDGARWRASQVGARTRPFRLSGGGTKRIPLARPQVLVGRRGAVYVVYRDEERGGGVSVAVSTDSARATWRVSELHAPSLGQWEPTLDPVAWHRDGRLSLLVQRVGQGDGETLEDVGPQPVQVLEWTP